MTQDDEFEKWWKQQGFEDTPTYRDKMIFRAGRMVQREKDAEICESTPVITNWNHPGTALSTQEQIIAAIRQQEI